MSWNNIPNDERLRLWKALRAEIASLALKKQLEVVVKFFSNMPFGAKTMNYYTPESWPTPWEILYHGSFCKNSISLLMFYTFTLLHPEYVVELWIINDNQDEYLVPVINKQYVLNYQPGAVNNYLEVSKEFNVIKVFENTQIKQIS